MTHERPQHSDIVIRNGTVIDGTGKARFAADVAVTNDRIVAIGALENVVADREFDASDCIVCPGFIDAHTHDDAALLFISEMTAKVSQGVTTVVAGNCGFSLAPLEPRRSLPPAFRLLGEETNYRFSAFADYVDALAQASTPVNAALLVGHSTLRCGAMDDLARAATENEIETMCRRLEEGLESGAIGFSTGLDYDSSTAATTDEVIAIAEVLEPHGGIYVTHTRDYFDDVEGAIEEALEIGRRACVPVVLSHHQVAGRRNFGLSKRTLEMIERAVEKQPVGLDAYPYTAGSTVIIPELVKHCVRVVITWSSTRPDMAGRDLASIAAEWSCSERDAAQRLAPGGAIYYEKDESDVRRILAYPRTMIGSDGLPHDEWPHPRLWGTFPRILGHYSRELGLFTLEEAVRRMTGLTAEQFGFRHRGVVRPGAYADLVVFDPDTVVDRSTYEHPDLPAVGIRFVMVNGVVVWTDGAATGERPGRLVRREAVTSE